MVNVLRFVGLIILLCLLLLKGLDRRIGYDGLLISQDGLSKGVTKAMEVVG